LFTKTVIDVVLVSVAVIDSDRDSVFVYLEAVVGPEGIVKGERTFSSGRWVN
jgi:hypothetical protein